MSIFTTSIFHICSGHVVWPQKQLQTHKAVHPTQQSEGRNWKGKKENAYELWLKNSLVSEEQQIKAFIPSSPPTGRCVVTSRDLGTCCGDLGRKLPTALLPLPGLELVMLSLTWAVEYFCGQLRATVSCVPSNPLSPSCQPVGEQREKQSASELSTTAQAATKYKQIFTIYHNSMWFWPIQKLCMTISWFPCVPGTHFLRCA